MAGLTAAGFEGKTLDTIKAEIEADLRGVLGEGLNLASSSPFGQLVGIFSSKLRELWELAESVYASQDPDTASLASLTALASLTGTVRQPATRSLVTCAVTVDPGTYAAGTLVASVTGRPAVLFSNRDPVVNDGAASAAVDAVFQASETGPVEALAGTLSTIATPVSGWSAVTNAVDAVEGFDVETDEALRARRLAELTLSGAAVLDAIRVALLRVEGVVSATVTENETDAVDAQGLPPHSFEALVYDGTPDGSGVAAATIGEAIWKTKPIGIATHGTEEVTVLDDRTVRFSRPDVLAAYLGVTLEVDEALGWDPVLSPPLVKEAIAAFGDGSLVVGASLKLAHIYVPIFSVPGVVDVIEVRAGLAPDPAATDNIPAGARDLIDLDTGRIDVVEA